jgi:hypothetical protein
MPALWSLATGALVLVGAAGLGVPVLRWLRARPDWLSATAAGLGIAAVALWMAGLGGLVYPAAGWGLLVFGIICSLRGNGWRLMGRDFRREASVIAGSGSFSRALTLGSVALAALAFVLALVPPIMYDTVAYHLVLPQQYRFIHKITASPWFMPASFPFLAHGGYLWAFLLGSSWRGPALVNWAHGLMCATAVFRLAGAAGLGREARLAAVLAWLSIPLVLTESSAPLSDLLACLYAVLAMTAFLKWIRRGGSRRLAAASAWCGLAGAAKYVAGAVAAPMAAYLAVSRRGPGAKLKSFLVFCGIFLVPLGPLIAKNILMDGVPFFPFLTGTLQERLVSGWNAAITPVSRDGWNLLAFPILLAWNGRPLFTHELWETGFILGVLYLIPLLAFRMGISGSSLRKHVPVIWLAGSAVALYLAWFLLRLPPRYLLAALAVCAVLWAAVAGPSRPGLAIALAILLGCAAPRVPRLLYPLKTWASAGFDTGRYLSLRHGIWPYRALAWIRDNTPADARVLTVFEPQVYYAERRTYSSLMHDYSLLAAVLANSRDFGEASRRLARLKVTHLLVGEALDPGHAAQFFAFLPERSRSLLMEIMQGGSAIVYSDGAYSVRSLKGVRR